MSTTIYMRVKCPHPPCGATIPVIENLNQLGVHGIGHNPDQGPPPEGVDLCPFSYKDIDTLDDDIELEIVRPTEEVVA